MSGPILVAVGGVLASGKSTVSSAIAAQLGAVRIEADELRAAFERGGRADAFVPGFSDIVYTRMFGEAEKSLGQGHAVVLDGTFRSRDRRERARGLAERHGVAFRFVECFAEDAVIRARLRQRPNPEGWLAMFDHFLKLWEPVDELLESELVRLDTSRPDSPVPGRAQLGLEPS